MLVSADRDNFFFNRQSVSKAKGRFVTVNGHKYTIVPGTIAIDVYKTDMAELEKLELGNKMVSVADGLSGYKSCRS